MTKLGSLFANGMFTLLMIGVIAGCGGQASVANLSNNPPAKKLQVRAAIKGLSPIWQQLGLSYRAAPMPTGAAGGGDQPGGPPDGIWAGDVPEGGDTFNSDPTLTSVSGYTGDQYGVWYQGTFSPSTLNYSLYSDAGLTNVVGSETYAGGPTTQGQQYPIDTNYSFSINSGPTSQKLSFDWLVSDADGLNSTLATNYIAIDGSGYQLQILTTNGASTITEVSTAPVSGGAMIKTQGVVVHPNPLGDVTVSFTQNFGLKGQIIVHPDASADGNLTDLGGAPIGTLTWNSTGNTTVTYVDGSTDAFDLGAVVQVDTTRRGILNKTSPRRTSHRKAIG